MTEPRSRRLARLLAVEEQLKAYHETRRAGLLRQAAEAERRARETAERKDDTGSLAMLFPDVYERAITRSLEERDRALAGAHEEAARVATETLRMRTLERSLREARREELRAEEERNALESVERMIVRRTAPDP